MRYFPKSHAFQFHFSLNFYFQTIFFSRLFFSHSINPHPKYQPALFLNAVSTQFSLSHSLLHFSFILWKKEAKKGKTENPLENIQISYLHDVECERDQCFFPLIIITSKVIIDGQKGRKTFDLWLKMNFFSVLHSFKISAWDNWENIVYANCHVGWAEFVNSYSYRRDLIPKISNTCILRLTWSTSNL